MFVRRSPMAIPEAFNTHLRLALSLTLLDLDPSPQIQGQKGEESPLQSPLLLRVSSFLCLSSTFWRGVIESRLRTVQTLYVVRSVVLSLYAWLASICSQRGSWIRTSVDVMSPFFPTKCLTRSSLQLACLPRP